MDEPVVAPTGATAGSSQLGLVLLLMAALAGLVAVSALGLEAGVLLTPFVPVLVAVQLRRDPNPLFVVASSIVALAVAGLVSTVRGDAPGLLVGLLACFLALAGPLAILQAWASRPDPVEEPEGLAEDAPRFDTQTGLPLHGEAWPEPRLTTGFSVVLLSWFVPMLLCIAVLLPAVGANDLRDWSTDTARGWFGYVNDACAPGGMLAEETATCERYDELEDVTVSGARSHYLVIFGVLIASVAFGGAWTSHQVTLWRLRRSRVVTRPKRPLREFEAHWSVAYATAFGLVLLIFTNDATSDAGRCLRAIGIATAVFGAQLIIAQGLALLAFALQGIRGGRRVALIIFGVLAWEFVLPLLVVLGFVDLAVHPRRRISGSLPRRGSES